jgi:2-keto-3-deoxy-L-rhamnonate aldolase RhmA
MVDSPTLENLTRAAEVAGTTLLVRLPSGDGDAVRKALDAGVRNVLDGILSVPDLGFVFVGPSDLSVSPGHPVEPDHPDVAATAERIRATAVERDVPVGCVANDAATAREAISEGYQVLRVGDEVAAAAEVLGDRLASIREAE